MITERLDLPYLCYLKVKEKNKSFCDCMKLFVYSEAKGEALSMFEGGSMQPQPQPCSQKQNKFFHVIPSSLLEITQILQSPYKTESTDTTILNTLNTEYQTLLSSRPS